MNSSCRSGSTIVVASLFLTLTLLLSPLRAQNATSAQEDTTSAEKAVSILVPAAGIRVDFGVPKRFDPAGSSYLASGAQIQSRSLEVPAAGAGVLLFSQGESLLATGFPRSQDNFIALAHEGGFVSVYSSPMLSIAPGLDKNKILKDEVMGSIGTGKGSGDANYYLRVADVRSKLQVNPALFSGSMIDRAIPRIEEVSLIRDGFRLKAEPERRILQRIAQGEYRLTATLNDPAYAGGVVSGLFRIKVVLDGQVVADRKFDSAQNADEGLVFLGLSAPSSALADREMRFLLGSRFLARGNHNLELTIYDFNGNAGTFLWRFIVE